MASADPISPVAEQLPMTVAEMRKMAAWAEKYPAHHGYDYFSDRDSCDVDAVAIQRVQQEGAGCLGFA